MATPGRKEAVGLRTTLRNSLKKVQHRRTALGLSAPSEVKDTAEFDNVLEELNIIEDGIETAIAVADTLIEAIDRRKLTDAGA